MANDDIGYQSAGAFEDDVVPRKRPATEAKESDVDPKDKPLDDSQSQSAAVLKDKPASKTKSASTKPAKTSVKSASASTASQGLPKQGRTKPAAQTDEGAAVKHALADSARDGESALWLDDTQLEVRDITPEQAAGFAEDEAKAREQAIADQLVTLARGQVAGVQIPEGLRTAAMGIGLVAGALLTLFVLSHALTATAALSALPTWLAWVVGSLVGAVALVLLVGASMTVRFAMKLRSTESIKLKVMQALSTRENGRLLCQQSAKGAVTGLKEYLREYPADNTEHLLKNGFTQDEIRSLRAVRTDLLEDRGLHDQPAAFVDETQTRFQSILNTVAQRHVASGRNQATVSALAGRFDVYALLGVNLAMLNRLMAVYNLRYSGPAAIQVLGKSIQYLVVSEAVELGAESLVKLIPKLAKMVVKDSPDGVLPKAANMAMSAEVVQMLANRRLTNRIGIKAMALLRPI